MAKRKSAGILLYRSSSSGWEVFLVHPGGPFWTNKENGAWSIPKGEFEDGEAPLAAALREFAEETGATLHRHEHFMELAPVVQKAGKQVYAWAFEGNIDAAAIRCNTFKVQWPPGSGQWKTFPEVDKAAWFSLADARQKINPAQVAFIEELIEKLNA